MIIVFFYLKRERFSGKVSGTIYFSLGRALNYMSTWLFDQIFISVTKSIWSYVVSLLQRCVHTNWITRASALRKFICTYHCNFSTTSFEKIMIYWLYFRFFTFIPFPQLWFISQNLCLILRGMCNERRSCIRTAFDLQANNHFNNTCAFFECVTFNTLVIKIMNKHALFCRIQGHIRKHNQFPFNLR